MLPRQPLRFLLADDPGEVSVTTGEIKFASATMIGFKGDQNPLVAGRWPTEALDQWRCKT